ncbi:MAG: hypothetical protein AAGG51_00600 [Cyanobacteria bacterium P01_G01_bin.54]
MTLPSYIDRGGEQCLRQPYQTQNTQSYGCFLRAEQDKLQALCDRYLNEPSGGAVSYVPLPFVLVLFTHYPHLASIPQQDQGFISYEEALFAVPVIEISADESSATSASKAKSVLGTIETFLSNGEDNLEQSLADIEALLGKLALFYPFIFANNSLAIASGREVYGYPKQWGWIDMPQDSGSTQPLNLEAATWQPLGINSQAVRQRIAQITNQTQTNKRRTVADPTALKTDRASIKTQLVQRTIAQDVDSQSTISLSEWNQLIELILIVLTRLFNVSFENVFLKEFRDAVDGTKSCSQAVLKAPYEQVKVSEFEYLLDQFVVEVPEVESMPIKAQLGLIPLSTEHPNQFQSIVPYRTVFDFQLVNGTLLWQADAS